MHIDRLFINGCMRRNSLIRFASNVTSGVCDSVRELLLTLKNMQFSYPSASQGRRYIRL